MATNKKIDEEGEGKKQIFGRETDAAERKEGRENDDEEANKALEECNGSDLDGREIKCSEATPRKAEH
mgnify:CR=1 FL=1